MLTEETGDFELDTQAGDIEIIGEDPMIISWGAFQKLSTEELNAYEPFRHPEAFRHFAFKTVWRKLRSLDAPEGMTVRGLLGREGDFNWSIKTFMMLVGCQVSFNVQEDLVYLGCDDAALIDKGVQRLDSLLKYRVSNNVAH